MQNTRIPAVCQFLPSSTAHTLVASHSLVGRLQPRLQGESA
jgi:hypothetical protein